MRRCKWFFLCLCLKKYLMLLFDNEMSPSQGVIFVCWFWELSSAKVNKWSSDLCKHYLCYKTRSTLKALPLGQAKKIGLSLASFSDNNVSIG